MFGRRKKINMWNEFTVLGAFAAVVVAGLLYAGVSIIMAYPQVVVDSAYAAPTAPTAAEYEEESRDVLEAFLSHALAMNQSDLDLADPILAELVGKTQERLLRLRVPKEYRDSHLSFVLLLDQWKRALGGSTPDRAVVLDKTERVVEANSWLQEYDQD